MHPRFTSTEVAGYNPEGIARLKHHGSTDLEAAIFARFASNPRLPVMSLGGHIIQKGKSTAVRTPRRSMSSSNQKEVERHSAEESAQRWHSLDGEIVVIAVSNQS